MFHQVDIIQPSHIFETVNICFISRLHKFHNVMYVNFEMTYATNTCLFRHTLLRFEALVPIMINLASSCVHALSEFVDSFAFKMYYQTEALIVKMIQVKRPISCLEFM